MFRLARSYKDDVPEGVNLVDWYRRVQRLPYIFDPPGVESIARPGLVFHPAIPWRDCDDKTVAMMAWAEKNDVAYRVVVCGENEKPHHVYPEIWIGAGWLPADATFPDSAAHRPKTEQRSRLGLRQYHEGVAHRFYPKKTDRGQLEYRQRTALKNF